MSLSYHAFLRNKQALAQPNGFSITDVDLNPMLFGFQKAIVKFALRKGRAAIWADCGLGKTPIQLVWAHHIIRHTNAAVLIFAPLAVSEQTVREGTKFGIPVRIVRHQSDIAAGINITNYEMLEHFVPTGLSGIVLDESSIIKHHDSKTRGRLIEFAKNIPYRLACTATPAPNDFMELGNHAEFLGVLKRMEMLAMFFVHDGGDTGKWRLKGHAKQEFWKWLASWAVVLRQPSDLDFPDDSFILPPLRFHPHVVKADTTGGYLFPVEAKTLHERREARRDSLSQRVALAARLVTSSSEPWIVWCNLNDESDALTRLIPGAIEIRGSHSREHKESSMAGFSEGRIRVLVTKPSIAGFGMNWQHCHNQAFVGLSDSFEEMYQAVRRCWRFGQNQPVDVHIITGEREGAVVSNIKAKESQAAELWKGMINHMKRLSLEEVQGKDDSGAVSSMQRAVTSERFTMHLGDACEVIKSIASDSIHYSVYSPPFASLYTYSDSVRDMGNCRNVSEFMEHYEFLVKELYRVLMAGRLISFHCWNTPTTLQNHGYIGLEDFRGDLIRLHQKHGFYFHSEVVIWKDPLIAATRTHAVGLAHKELVKDSAISRQGIPDYLVTMRKPGENQEPITHGPAGLSRWIGEVPGPNGHRTRDPRTNKHSHLIWQRYASPVWMDIDASDTLQYESAREHDDERHICPLQLQVIERALELWSNPGDLILSPFAGIGSEGYVALRSDRRFIGIELKHSYWKQAVANLRNAETNFGQKVLWGESTRSEETA